MQLVTSAEDDAEPPVPPPKEHKETTVHMLDQIKRSAFVNKWFAKKKESETSANEAGAAPPPISTGKLSYIVFIVVLECYSCGGRLV